MYLHMDALYTCLLLGKTDYVNLTGREDIPTLASRYIACTLDLTLMHAQIYQQISVSHALKLETIHVCTVGLSIINTTALVGDRWNQNHATKANDYFSLVYENNQFLHRQDASRVFARYGSR